MRRSIASLSAKSLGLLALLLAAGAARGQAARPLLSFHARTRALTGRQLLLHRDFVVTQDGRTTGRTCDSELGGVGWSSQPPVDRVPPRPALEELTRALAETRIGTLPAACRFENGLPLTGAVEITWYGSGRRFRELRFALNDPASPEAPCPGEVAVLLSAIDAFLARAAGI